MDHNYRPPTVLPTNITIREVMANRQLLQHVHKHSTVGIQLRKIFLTENNIADFMGFSGIDASRALKHRFTKHMDPARIAACFKNLSGGGTAGASLGDTSLEAQWDDMHRTNSIALLLSTQGRQIHTLRSFEDITLIECGMQLHPLQQPVQILLLASPDGILICNGKPEFVLQYASFLPYKALGEGDSFAYTGHTSEDARVMAHHYVACQMSMLATGIQRSLLTLYGPDQTRVFEVPANAEWCARMVEVAGTVKTQFLDRGEVPMDGCYARLVPDYDAFLSATLKGCIQAHSSYTVLNSIQGPDSRMFRLSE
jgi:hypothetical protein